MNTAMLHAPLLSLSCVVSVECGEYPKKITYIAHALGIATATHVTHVTIMAPSMVLLSHSHITSMPP